VDIRVPTWRTVASTAQTSRRLALIGAAALLIAACLPGHPARFIFARNDSGHETRVRFSEGTVVRVYRLPAGFDGLVEIIDALYRPSVEILDSSCKELGPAPVMEGAGGHLLQIGPGTRSRPVKRQSPKSSRCRRRRSSLESVAPLTPRVHTISDA
jgi:hypothetical protein